MKTSLKQLIFGIIITSVTSLFMLGGSTLILNARLSKNQELFLKASSIESARYKMSSSLSLILAMEGEMITARTLKDIHSLPSRAHLVSHFKEGLNALITEAQQTQEVTQALYSLKKTYQGFALLDKQLFDLTQSTVITRIDLYNLTQNLNSILEDITDKDDNINGILSLQYRRNAVKVIADLKDKSFLSTASKKKEFVGLATQLFEGNLSNAQRVSEKLKTNFISLTNLMRWMAEETDPDILNSLKNNQAAQLTTLIKSEISQLSALLQNDPERMTMIKEINKQLDDIFGKLIGKSTNIYQLRVKLNNKEVQLQKTIQHIKNKVSDFITQFDRLDRVTTTLRTKLVKTAEKLIRANRVQTTSMVIIVLLFMSLMGFLVLRAISRTLNMLIAATKKIAGETGGLKSQLETTQFEDINQLIVSFNIMASKLDYTHEHLQEMVQSKTKALSGTNKKLEKIVMEYKKAKDEAESANKIKSDFVANMSHELRTPLNAVIGYSEILIEDLGDAGYTSYIGDLQKITSSAKHLLSLINDVLDLSKIEAGKMDVFLEQVNTKELVNELSGVIQPLFEKNHNTLTVSCATDLGLMKTDLVRLRQCLLNLLSNASKFTDHGRVTLDVKRVVAKNGIWIHFIVKDTGLGMSKEKLQKLFTAFTQADTSTTRKYGGTGLGLFLTKRFAIMLGGMVTVTSVPNEGSTFTLVLPEESSTVKSDKEQ